MTPLAPITTCGICKAQFDGGVEIIGKPNARIEVLLMKLGAHVSTAHPRDIVNLATRAGVLMEMLLLDNFTSTDEGFKSHRDRIRWQIHQQTLNARFSDESLREQCNALAVRMVDTVVRLDHYAEGMVAHENDVAEAFSKILYEVMASVRDALEEPNRYAPDAPKVELVS